MYAICIFYGGLFGVIGLSIISSMLQPYPDDMYTYLFYSIPFGALLGWITGGTIASVIDKKFIIASVTSLMASVLLGIIHIQSLRHENHLTPPRVPISYEAAGLFWCFLLFVMGIYSLFQIKKRRPAD